DHPSRRISLVEGKHKQDSGRGTNNNIHLAADVVIDAVDDSPARIRKIACDSRTVSTVLAGRDRHIATVRNEGHQTPSVGPDLAGGEGYIGSASIEEPASHDPTNRGGTTIERPTRENVCLRDSAEGDQGGNRGTDDACVCNHLSPPIFRCK